MKIKISALKQIIKESVDKQQQRQKVKSDKFQYRNTPENLKKRDATAGVTRTDSGELKETAPSLMDVTSLDDAESEMDASELNDFQAYQQFDPDSPKQDFDEVISAITDLANEKGISVDEISEYLKLHKDEITQGREHPETVAQNAVDRINFKKSLGNYPKNYKPGNKTSDRDFMIGMNYSPETMLPGIDDIKESLFGDAGAKVRKPLGPEFGFDSKRGLDFDNTRHFNNIADKGGIEGLKSKLSTLKPDEIDYLRKLSPQDFTKLVDQLEKNKK